MIFAAVVALVAIASCTRPLADPEVARAPHPCLPDAISPQFFFWPVVGLRTVGLLTEDGRRVEASWVLYRRGHAAVAAMWVGSELAAVDAEVDTDSPEWIDLSLVTVFKGALVLRREPEAPCRWARWIHSEVLNRPGARTGGS